MPIAGNERLPKEPAVRGLTSTLRSRNLEEETQHKERIYSEHLTGQAGQTTSEIGNWLAAPGRPRVGLESHRPVRAWARDLEKCHDGAGAGWTGHGRPDPARPYLRELAHPLKPLHLKYWIFYNLKISRNMA